MQPRRPTSVLVLAIFHFLFGAFGLIAGLVGVGFGAVALAQPQPPPGYRVTSNPPTVMDTMKYMDSNVPQWRAYQLASSVLGLVLSVALIVAGIGLVLMKPWARGLSIAFAVGSILYQLCGMLYMIVYVTPVQVALYDQLPPMAGMPPAQQQSMTAMSKTIAGCTPFGAVIGLVYPVVVLIIMVLPSVRAAFRGESAGPDDGAGRYDRGDDRPPPGYGDAPPGYGGEPDDRFGSAPR